MIALDTNVLVRFIVQDDPEQSKTASGLIEGFEADGEACFISDITLCELVWVLESCYKTKREKVVQALEKILRTEIFAFAEKGHAQAAAERYQKGRGDFADYLMAAGATHRGATVVYTFDKDLAGEASFKVLS